MHAHARVAVGRPRERPQLVQLGLRVVDEVELLVRVRVRLRVRVRVRFRVRVRCSLARPKSASGV